MKKEILFSLKVWIGCLLALTGGDGQAGEWEGLDTYDVYSLAEGRGGGRRLVIRVGGNPEKRVEVVANLNSESGKTRGKFYNFPVDPRLISQDFPDLSEVLKAQGREMRRYLSRDIKSPFSLSIEMRAFLGIGADGKEGHLHFALPEYKGPRTLYIPVSQGQKNTVILRDPAKDEEYNLSASLIERRMASCTGFSTVLENGRSENWRYQTCQCERNPCTYIRDQIIYSLSGYREKNRNQKNAFSFHPDLLEELEVPKPLLGSEEKKKEEKGIPEKPSQAPKPEKKSPEDFLPHASSSFSSSQISRFAYALGVGIGVAFMTDFCLGSWVQEKVDALGTETQGEDQEEESGKSFWTWERKGKVARAAVLLAGGLVGGWIAW